MLPNNTESSKEDLREKWIENLESGKYKQGKNALRNRKNEFCCFGVLCDISGVTYWEKIGVDYSAVVISNNMIKREATPPKEVYEKVGLTYNETNFLMNLNDSGFRFTDIANQLRGIFDDGNDYDALEHALALAKDEIITSNTVEKQDKLNKLERGIKALHRLKRLSPKVNSNV